MNAWALIVISVLLLSGALAAAFLPRLVHAALAAVAAFVGVACLYFLLGAEFLGLVQIFVYVGAVAILIVFTILLTHPDEKSPGVSLRGALGGLGVFAALAWAVAGTDFSGGARGAESAPTVETIGRTLMSGYVWPLMGIGLLLTAALVGALILVMEEKE